MMTYVPMRISSVCMRMNNNKKMESSKRKTEKENPTLHLRGPL